MLGARIGGDVLSQTVHAQFAAHRHADVPMLLGWKGDDGRLFVNCVFATPTQSVAEKLRMTFGAAAPRVQQAYAGLFTRQSAQRPIEKRGNVPQGELHA